MPELSPKTVCMIIAAVEVPNTSGLGSGGSTHAIEVLKGFQRKRLPVILFCAQGRGQSASEELNGSHVHRIFRWGKAQDSWLISSSLKSYRRQSFFLEPLRVVYRFLRSVIQSLQILVRLRGHNITVVYERTSGSTLAGTFVAFAKRVPLICEINDLAFSQLSLHVARHIITPSADVLPASFGNKCVTMSWGVDINHFSPQKIYERLQSELELQDKRVVLFTGSCLPWHGILDIVEAAAIVCSSDTSICFLVVGDGPIRGQAELRVREKRLTDHFRFTGFIPYDELPSYMALAEVAVAPYTSDLSGNRAKIASPLKVLEYMSMGIPTVVSKSGNHQGFIESGVNGYVFSTGDVPEMAAALLRLLSNKSMIAQMGRSAREKCVTKYSWEAHCNAIAEMVDLID